MRPLCFVLMPFGEKPDPTGRAAIPFDRIYETSIRPAIEGAGLRPVRADEEKTGGIIHKPMFERLLLCEYAVADLTTANANVFYELGIRHTARPRTTQTIFARHQPIPFDVNFLRALPYELGANNRFGPGEAAALREALAGRLNALRGLASGQAAVDSPVFQLVSDWKPPAIPHGKTDVFRERVDFSEALKARLARARSLPRAEGLAMLTRIRHEMGAPDAQEAGVIIDLMLSYRALKGWEEMIDLYEAMPESLKRVVLVREQLAFAFNRRAGEEGRSGADRTADRESALRILEDLEEQQGPNPETSGLIGRVYKDLWDADRAVNPALAKGYLRRAIDAYVRGYEADFRDAYPGINAVTLLDVEGSSQSKSRRDQLLPVVRFAVEQRLRSREADYWDHATMLELAVLASDRERAAECLSDALASVREVWEPETTARNLRLIREARAGRGEDAGWLDEMIAALEAAARR